MFRPGMLDQLTVRAGESDRTVNWLVNEAVEKFLKTAGPTVSATGAAGERIVLHTPKEVKAYIEQTQRPKGQCRHGLASCRVCQTGSFA